MKRRILIFVLAMVLCVGALASCQLNFGNNGITGGKGDPKYPESIVHNADMKADMRDVAKTLEAQWGNKIHIIQDGFEKEGPEIVIGETNRAITAEAKRRLTAAVEAEMERTGETDIAAYIVYSDGDSTALYWNVEYAIEFAVEFFVNDYVNAEKLPFTEEYSNCKFFDISDYKEEIEAADREARLAEVAELLGQEAADALRNHLSIITDDFYIFLANLYSPRDCICEPDEDGYVRCKLPKDAEGKYICSGGGFYYSPSARDNEGYLPDIESTVQVLNFLGSSGMASEYGGWVGALPMQMKLDMLAFARSLQDPDDGYFYHPQWGKNISTSRLSRDLGWATQLIEALGEQPFWDTNNGKKGIYGAPGRGVGPVSYITEPLYNSSAVSAVSKVIAVSDDDPSDGSENYNTWPNQLKTVEAFEEYLDGFNLATSSYSAGNTISSQGGQINSRDKQYIKDYILDRIAELQEQHPGDDYYFTDWDENGIPDAMDVDKNGVPDIMDEDGNGMPDALDVNNDGIADGGFREAFQRHFNDAQNPENGLWEAGVYYNSVNGLMKISSGYNTLKIPLPYAEKAFESAVYVALLETADVKGKQANGSVDVYNPWVAMSQIISNVKNYSKDQATSEALRVSLQENAAAMISVTTQKIIKFKKVDGSFGYTWTSSPATSQGAPASVPGSVEGDVNGGCIATRGTWGNMCTALGVSIPLYYSSDMDVFLGIISELSPVTKQEIVTNYEPSTFDDDVAGLEESDDIAGFTTTAGGMQVIEDPREGAEGNVLKFYNTPSTAGTTVKFGVNEESKDPTCLTLEWEMCVTENKKSTTILQIKLGSAYMLVLNATSTTVKILDASNTNSPKYTNDFGVSFGVGEWHKIRIEYYLMEDGTLTKIFLDDELRIVSDNYYMKGQNPTPSKVYAQATFFQLASTNVTVLLDNVSANKTSDTYKEEPIINPDYNRDFESIDTTAPSTTLPSGVTATMGGSSSATVIADPTTKEENNVLHINASSGDGKDSVVVNANQSSSTANVFISEFDIYVGEDSSVGELMTLYFCASNSSSYIAAFSLETYTESRTDYVRLVELWGNKNTPVSYELGEVGEWIHVKLEYYRYQYEYDEAGEIIATMKTIIYANDEEIGRSDAYYSLNMLSKDSTCFKFAVSSGVSVDVYLDNIIIDKNYKEYVDEDGNVVADPETPTFPKGGESTDTKAPTTGFDGKYDFESDTVGELPATPGLKTTVNGAEYGNNITIAADPTGAANNVLKHESEPSNANGNTQTYTAANNDSTNGDCYVFEFDIYVVKNAAAQIYLNSVADNNSGTIFGINLAVRTSSIEITNARSSSSGTVPINQNVTTDGWTTFRIEYYKSVGVAKFFIGAQGAPEYITEVECHWGNNGTLPYNMAKFYTTYGANAELYFDNVTVATIDKDYVTGETNP